MLRFSVFGFPVQVHWLFWVTCAVLGGGFYAKSPADWMEVAIFAAVVFVSIMAHELGHAVVGKRLGAHPAILLHGLGGLTVLPNLRASRPQSVMLSLAGPLAGLALGALVFLLAPVLNTGERIAQFTIASLLYVNIFWSLFNLLPILPMDGGQILRALLGPRRLRASAIVGTAVAVALCGLALLAGMWILAIFMGFLAYNNYRSATHPAAPVQGGVHHG